MRKQLFDKTYNKPKILAWERSLIEDYRRRHTGWGLGGGSTKDRLERGFIRDLLKNKPLENKLLNNPSVRAQVNGGFHYESGHDTQAFKEMVKAYNKIYNRNPLHRFVNLLNRFDEYVSNNTKPKTSPLEDAEDKIKRIGRNLLGK